MPLDLQRLVGPIQVKGTVDDPLYVIVQGISITSFSNADSALAVPDNTLTTIVTQAFVATVFENIVLVSVSGDVYAKYFLVVNGSIVDTRRTGPDRNLTFDFTGGPFQLAVGDIVDIKVEHYTLGGLYNFEATIYGYGS